MRSFYVKSAVAILTVAALVSLGVYLVQDELLKPTTSKIEPDADIFLQLSTQDAYENIRVGSENPSRGKVPNETYVMKATAYTHTGYNTASGVYPTINNTIAADPDVLAIGTLVLINGEGPYKVEDTGCRNNVLASDGYFQHIQGNRIDIFMDTRDECIDFGRREVVVEVVKGDCNASNR